MNNIILPDKDEIRRLRIAIIDLLKMSPAVDFVRLEAIDGFGGKELIIARAGNASVCLWPWVSTAAQQAMKQLLEEKRLHIQPSNPFIYFGQGRIPGLPIAQGQVAGPWLHWMPCIICAGPPPQAPRIVQPVIDPSRLKLDKRGGKPI